MSFHSLLLSLLVFWCLVAGVLAEIQETPFIVPNSALEGFSWPHPSAWAVLNASLSGRLQVLRPWAAVCYTDDPLYDLAKCQVVLSNYTNPRARENIPSALLWANWESCHNSGCALDYSDPRPVSGEPCYQGTTPPYSITITSAQDACDVVNWATSHNVTLTIKNTGHDYLGRSARPFSLQVLTHSLNNVEYVSDFVPQGVLAIPVPAIKVGAGAQLEAVYSVAEANNASVMLGSCLTVGAAGGFIQGGGAGFLSPTHGLAVHNLIEVEIVTADGIFRTINAAQDPDLFWAVGGGGAGNWGIIISITLATLPPTTVSASFLAIAPNPTQNLHTLGVDFIALTGKYQNHFVNSGIATSLFFVDGSYSLGFMWPAGKASVSLLYPLFEEIRALSKNYTVSSNVTQEDMYSSVSTAVFEGIGPVADAGSFYGSSTFVSSRFIPQSVLEGPESIRTVAEAIWQGKEIAAAPIAGVNPDIVMCFFGSMPAAMKQQVNATGANPGFYDAAWQVSYFGSWSQVGLGESAYYALSQAMYDAVGPMTALGLTGSYQNEGSTLEENWKEAFFGYKYDRLLEIKQKYDPTNFFTTFKAVGSEPDSPMYSCYQTDWRADIIPEMQQYTNLFT